MPPVLFFGLALLASLSLIWGEASGENAGPLAHMRDVAGELAIDIDSTAANGLAKTRSLAADRRLPGAIRSGDRAAAEAIANDLLAGSLEVDVVAIFDAEGRLLAVNTVDHRGEPVRPEGIEALYAMDSFDRDVIVSCVRNTSSDSSLEFQTRCDFTPAFFGSSGLSVAMSAPVLDGEERIGVVSTRLNFERITSLIRENAFVRAGNSVFLVSDSGEFFDEGINAGRTTAPLTPEQVRAALPGARSEGGGSEGGGEVLVRRDGAVLFGVPVTLPETVAAGGIHVLVRASEGWITGQTVQARIAAGVALIGSLAGIGLWGLYMAARVERLRALAAVSQERAKTSLILSSAADGVMCTDADGVITFANPAACQALRLEPGGLLSRRYEELLAAPASPRAHGGRIDLWRADDARLRRGDGTQLPCRMNVSTLPDGAGAVITFSDMTEVLEREEERADLNRKLVEVSRQAGMAEVASGVLHNVGNVLNSVNVSTNLVADRLRTSRLPGLRRAVTAMQRPAPELAAFLTEDPSGRKLPEYLVALADKLEGEQEGVLRELETLTKNVEHIKEVVSMQQSYATVSPVQELESLGTLVEDALRITAASLTKHQVEVVREFRPVPMVYADKHKLLQILVNLISNAKHAVDERTSGDRRITVRLEALGGSIRFQIADNGVGIAPENLAMIFAHGFTTKKNGHGFGLHSAALAAKSLGGTLRAESDGAGCGAVFTLEIPIAAASRADDAPPAARRAA